MIDAHLSTHRNIMIYQANLESMITINVLIVESAVLTLVNRIDTFLEEILKCD